MAPPTSTTASTRSSAAGRTAPGAMSPNTAAAAPPVLGTTATLTVSNIPAGSLAGAELIGGVQNPGLDLGALNMPGCFLHVVPTYVTVPFNAGGTSATTPLPIPSSTNLTGLVLA